MRGVHSFSKGTNQKVNLIAQLGIKLFYFKATTKHFQLDSPVISYEL